MSTPPNQPIRKPAPFTWPPRTVSPASPGAPAAAEVVRGPELSRTWRDAVREAIDDTRRTWLDLMLPRLEERFAASGFVSDRADAYCPKCGLTAQGELGPDGCEECQSRRPAWKRVVRLGTYSHPLAEVIRQIKFSRWRRLGYDLGVVMGRSLAAELPSPRPPIVLVPVPMSWRRRMVRGIDHSLAICRGVKASLGRTARISRVLRRRHGPSQLQVLPGERSGNVGRMVYPARFGFRSVSDAAIVVVVDDVMTTGATMRACCRAMKEGLSGVGKDRMDVWALVAARTEVADGDRDGDGDVA